MVDGHVCCIILLVGYPTLDIRVLWWKYICLRTCRVTCACSRYCWKSLCKRVSMQTFGFSFIKGMWRQKGFCFESFSAMISLYWSLLMVIFVTKWLPRFCMTSNFKLMLANKDSFYPLAFHLSLLHSFCHHLHSLVALKPLPVACMVSSWWLHEIHLH